MSKLTPAQIEVIECLAQGMRAKDVAAHRGCSPKTVDVLTGQILERLNARNSTHAVAIYLQRDTLCNTTEKEHY